MKSSYIFTHCDGIDMVFLMPELFGGMAWRAWGCMAEGLVGRRDQARRRGIWRRRIGVVVFPAPRYQGIVANGGNNEWLESGKTDVDCDVDVGDDGGSLFVHKALAGLGRHASVVGTAARAWN
jgi:hypothetical protein